MMRQPDDPGDFDPRDSMIPPGGCLPPWLVLAVLALFGVLCLLIAWPAFAHEATSVQGQPLGWKYPWACCSNLDCTPVPDSAISEGPDGYTIKSTGEVIAYADKRIKDSPDGTFHWCAHRQGIDAGRTICLYVPPRGF